MKAKTLNDRVNEILNTTQRKSYFIVFVTLLFIMAMVIFGILPAYSAFIFQSNENQKRDDLISKLSDKLLTSKSLTEEYTSKTDLINYFNQIFPNDSAQDNVIQIILSKVKKNAVTLDGITFSNQETDTDDVTAATGPKVKKETLNAVLDGSQTNLLSFISDIENSSRVFNIVDMTISKKSEQELLTSSATGEYKLTLQINYYYYDRAAALAADSNSSS